MWEVVSEKSRTFWWGVGWIFEREREREREREEEMFVKFCLNMKKISGSTY